MNKTMMAAVIAMGTLSAGVAQADTMWNGQSVYGRSVTADASTKVVDLASAKALNVTCGDVVTFVNGSQRFTWRFDTVSHRAVPLAKVAPAGFGATQQVVYVSRNSMERG